MACLLGQVQPIPGGENLGDDLEEAGGKLAQATDEAVHARDSFFHPGRVLVLSLHATCGIRFLDAGDSGRHGIKGRKADLNSGWTDGQRRRVLEDYVQDLAAMGGWNAHDPKSGRK